MVMTVALLAGCGERAQPLAPAEAPVAHPESSLVNNDSQGLTRMRFPAEFPGVPAYARIESLTPQIFIVDGWAVIAFYRNPDCVRPDFNLLEFFDAPAAFGCALTVEGFALFEPGVFPGAPKVAHLNGKGAVPFWFVPAEILLAALQDDVLTIAELKGLEGLVVGHATQFTEMLQPTPDPILGGGNPKEKLVQSASGTLQDGRHFQYHLTKQEGTVISIGLRFR
jgi:hypothetical protein